MAYRHKKPGRLSVGIAILSAIAVLAAIPTATTAQIYKWTDADGTEHYTTTPPPNANIVTPPEDTAPPSPETKPPAPDLQRETVRNSPWDGSVSQVKQYLKRNLNDPRTVEYIEWSPVDIVDAPNHRYMVRCKYRAKNRLGAYVIENQIFYLSEGGEVVSIMDWR